MAIDTPPVSAGGHAHGRGWSWAWRVLGGLALLVGLLTGAVALYDRFLAPGGPPSYKADLSATDAATALVAFADAHDGEVVELDLYCDEGVPGIRETACFFETVTGGWEIMWVFTGERCFSRDHTQPLDACVGGNAFWVDAHTPGTTAIMANGPGGAGTYILRGRFHVRGAGFGGSVFPANIRSYRLIATPD
jgi:hypothetical protein